MSSRSSSDVDSDETELGSFSSSEEQFDMQEIIEPLVQQPLHVNIPIQQISYPVAQQEHQAQPINGQQYQEPIWNQSNQYVPQDNQQPILLNLDDHMMNNQVLVEWEVHSIVGHHVSNGMIYYRVRWSPPGEWEDTLEPSINCQCDNLIRQYFERHLFLH